MLEVPQTLQTIMLEVLTPSGLMLKNSRSRSLTPTGSLFVIENVETTVMAGHINESTVVIEDICVCAEEL